MKAINLLSTYSLVLFATACSSTNSHEPVPGVTSEALSLQAVNTAIVIAGQPLNQVFDVTWKDGVPIETGSSPLPASAYQIDTRPPAAKTSPASVSAPRTLDVDLDMHVAAAEQAKQLDSPIDVVVTFREELQIPRFPAPMQGEARNSASNTKAAADAAQLVRDITSARAPAHTRRQNELTSQFGATVQDKFWLINGMQISLPIGNVRALANRLDVQYVEEQEKNIPPPANNSSDARADMSTDPYFNLNETGGWIGLLDTGVRISNTLLSHAGYLRDCVDGGSDCDTGAIDFDDDVWNHGTSSMSELTANGNLGDANRGVSGITVDSWKVYSSSGQVTAAVVRGFQEAIPALDRVIVAEVQDTGNENGAIASAADAAYAAGAVVVAANGNFGPATNTVRSPANARKALGVGAADVTSLALQSYSGRGPTNDGRTKPDVLGPTDVNAASNTGGTALQNFAGTSAATPNVGGATALMRNFIRGSNIETDPGQINAIIINAGRNANNPGIDDDNGAGFVTLPGVNSHSWIGSVTAQTTQSSIVNVTLPLSGITTQTLTATLWWPESIGGSHNDVDLYVVNPTGGFAASSTTVQSIFEKTRVPSGSLTNGNWMIQIKSFNVKTTQTVYYAVDVQ